MYVHEEFCVRVDSEARNLTRAWLALGCAALGLAALYAIVLVAARVPQIEALVPDGRLFRPALVQHVVLATVVWLLAMPCALASAVSTRAYDGLRWWLWVVALTGVVIVVLAPAAGGGALLIDYVPLIDNGFFKCGIALYACAVCGTVLVTACERRPTSPSTFPSRAMIVWCCMPLIAAFVSLLLSGVQLPRELPTPLYFQTLFWAPGHVLQFAHVTYLLIAWLGLAWAAGLNSRTTNRIVRACIVLSVVPVLAVPALHLAYGPSTAEFLGAYTRLMQYGAALAAVPAGAVLLWSAGRHAARSSAKTVLVLSIMLFLAGCAIGITIAGQTTVIPAHYHGAVGAVTLAYMGVIARLLDRPSTSARGYRMFEWSAVYGAGVVALVAGLAWCGYAGFPRKLPWPIGQHDVPVAAAMFLIAVGGTLAVVAVAAYALAVLRILVAGSHRGSQRRHPRDVRKWAAVGTVASIALVGSMMATVMSGPGVSAVAVAPDARVDPRAHADARRRAEVAERFNQAVVMLHAKQYEHALTALHRVLELSPEMPEAHVNMGFALLGLGRAEAARDFFDSALALRPSQHNGYYGLAMALEALQDIEGAVGAMRTYVHLSKTDEPHRRKAQAALWEWETRLAEARSAAPRRLADATGK